MFLRIGTPAHSRDVSCHQPWGAANNLLQPVLRVHVHDGREEVAQIEGMVELKGRSRNDPYFDLDIRLFQTFQDQCPDWAERIEESVRMQFSPTSNRPWTTRDFRSRPAVMGILNVTPDSFYDGGSYLDPVSALRRAEGMIEEGVDIIDVGGESTRPFSLPVDGKDEASRVVPVIRDVRSTTGLTISVDTSKEEVARKALDAGADMINDVTGLREPGMLALASDADVPVVIMHMRGNPTDMQSGIHYDDVVREVVDELKHSADRAIEHGVKREHIILDPGIGFGKTARDNLEIVKRLRELRCLGFPLMVGASRKSFIGRALGTDDKKRLEGSLTVASTCMRNGADIVRVHDVQETIRALQMTDALESLTI
ncbi:MAG: dihydropteroate synthase [Candidatus Methanomethylophilaceae archaeon]|nr:dihydropteroate synthase [Candidatus Methanomethylophilaceae archaeon]